MIEIKAKLVNGKIEVDESLLPKIDSEINIQILESVEKNGNGIQNSERFGFDSIRRIYEGRDLKLSEEIIKERDRD